MLPFLFDIYIKLIYNMYVMKGIDVMKKITTSINLTPEVFEMFKEQAKEKGLDRGAYLTHLLHEKNNKNDFQKKLEGIFLEALKKGTEKDE